jgi:hypothetical protein
MWELTHTNLETHMQNVRNVASQLISCQKLEAAHDESIYTIEIGKFYKSASV